MIMEAGSSLYVTSPQTFTKSVAEDKGKYGVRGWLQQDPEHLEKLLLHHLQKLHGSKLPCSYILQRSKSFCLMTFR